MSIDLSTIDLSKCLVMCNGPYHKTLLHFGKKVDGSIRDVYGFSGHKEVSPMSAHHWYRIKFDEILHFVRITSSQLVDFLNNDLTQHEIDALSMQLCPELPLVAHARITQQEYVMEAIRQLTWDIESANRLAERVVLAPRATNLSPTHSVRYIEVDEGDVVVPVSFDAIPKVIEISKECCVCMEAEKLLLFACQHVVCYVCFQKISSQCPMCRVPVAKSMIKRI